jgi:hypothetical protein
MSIFASEATQQTRVLAITRRDGALSNGFAVARPIWANKRPARVPRACGAHFVVPRNIDILLRASS